MATEVIAYRGRNDDGSETTATWKESQNTPWLQPIDVNFRVRFRHQQSVAALSNLDVQLQYNRNGLGWNNVSASSTVVRASASANLADGANLTTQLTGGSGTYIGATAFDEVNGICGGNSLDVTSTGVFETEFCCQLRSADVAQGDTIELKTRNSDAGADWQTYTVTASMTADFPARTFTATDALGSYSDTDGLAVDKQDLAGVTPLTAELSDGWGTLGDTLQAGIPRRGWQDSAAATLVVLGAAEITVTPAADPLSNWTDPLAATLNFRVSQSADALVYSDQAPTITAALTVALSDSLGLYSDQAPAINLSFRVTPPAESLGLYADQAPTIYASLRADLAADSLGLYTDQPPTLSESINARPTADVLVYSDQAPTIIRELLGALTDSLAAYGDALSGRFTFAIVQSDDLNQWLDQRSVFISGLAAITIEPLADSLGLYADQPPTIFRQGFLTVTLPADSLVLGDSLTVNLGAVIRPGADPLPAPVDQLARIVGKLASLAADAMVSSDQFSGAFKYFSQLSDAFVSYGDQVAFDKQISGITPLSVTLTDGLANWGDSLRRVIGQRYSLSADTLATWNDQVARSAMPRNGWLDSITVVKGIPGVRSVSFTDTTLAIYADSSNWRIGLSVGTIVYLVDGLGNYIVDENGNRILAAPGLLDTLQQSDSLAVTRTILNITPKLVALTDALPTYADSLQVSRGIVTLEAPLSDALPVHSDALIFVSYIGLLNIALSDALGGYTDTNPVMTTSGEQRVSLSDLLANYNDPIQVRRIGILSVSLSDFLGGYNDPNPIADTRGGLLISPSADSLADYTESLQAQRIGAISISLDEAIGGSFQDALAAIQSGLLSLSLSDNLANYADSPVQRRGLIYALSDNLAGYIDVVTTSGVGQLQVALFDNLGQYNDAPAAFADFLVKPPADNLHATVDSLAGLFGLNYAVSDEIDPFVRFFDNEPEFRLGEFNELRYELTDETLDQWADAAAYTSTFFALRLNGKVQDQVSLTGKVIAEQISINGKAVENADITGGLYRGDSG